MAISLTGIAHALSLHHFLGLHTDEDIRQVLHRRHLADEITTLADLIKSEADKSQENIRNGK